MCGVWCVMCGVWCVMCGVWCVCSTLFHVWCMVCVLYIIPSQVFSSWHAQDDTLKNVLYGLQVCTVALSTLCTPYIQYPTPCTMHHAPCTMHHAPRTTHHAPCTMHHTPTQDVAQQYNDNLLKLDGGPLTSLYSPTLDWWSARDHPSQVFTEYASTTELFSLRRLGMEMVPAMESVAEGNINNPEAAFVLANGCNDVYEAFNRTQVYAVWCMLYAVCCIA